MAFVGSKMCSQTLFDVVSQFSPLCCRSVSEFRQQGSSDAVYSAKTLAAAVVTTCLLAMVIGFLAGWHFSQRWARNDHKSCYESTDRSTLKQVETSDNRSVEDLQLALV